MEIDNFCLLEALPAGGSVAYWKGEFVTRDGFLSHVAAVADSLPEHQYVVNLCEDRYVFLVTFVACMLRGQTSLLPPSRAIKEIEAITTNYPDCYHIVDTHGDRHYPREFLAALSSGGSAPMERAEIPNDLLAAVVFTSGTSGVPQPNAKRWRELVAGAMRVKRRFGFGQDRAPSIVATVPPQHMFGLETSIIYPLVNGGCVHGGKPFYPDDIRRALWDMPAPRVLTTTPLHLRACGEADLQWPEIESVVSATACLSTEVAGLAEQRLKTIVREIYGCSEAGAIATRRTTTESSWRLLDGYELKQRLDGVYLTSSDSDAEIALPDKIRIQKDRTFGLLDRHSDLVKIGGKRASLADLTAKLKRLDGVEDGVFLCPDVDEDKRVRLAALVVAPDLDEAQILMQLADSMDRVFLPRLILKVDRLPYNETGKLPRKALLAILTQARGLQPLQESA